MSEIEQEEREEAPQQPREEAASPAGDVAMDPVEDGGSDEVAMNDAEAADEALSAEQETTVEEPAALDEPAQTEMQEEVDSMEEAEATDAPSENEEAPDDEPVQVEEAASEPVEEDRVEQAQAEVEQAADEEAEEAEDSEEETPVREPDDGRMWYVVHCYSGYENKVRHNLEQRIDTMGMKDRIFDVVVPTEEEIEIKDGKRRNVERRVFPGYILVQMLMDEDSWYVVRNTPGVTGFVGMGNEPTPLRPEEVSQIIKRMEAEAPRIKVTYKIGQKVRIIDGPFNDFIGTVSDIDMDRAKVRVMVSFFGRETPVELDFLQVEKA